MPIYFEAVPEENLKIKRKFSVPQNTWKKVNKKDPSNNSRNNQDGKISRKKMMLIRRGSGKKLLGKNAIEKSLPCTYHFRSSKLTLEKGRGLQMPISV